MSADQMKNKRISNSNSNFGVGRRNGSSSVTASNSNGSGGAAAAGGTNRNGASSANGNVVLSEHNGSPRETGHIDMLSHSYGFITCREREGRLFFHFSELHTNPSQLRVGDLVEFQNGIDRRSGRATANSVVRLEEDMLDLEEIGPNILEGCVVSSAGRPPARKQPKDSAGGDGDGPTQMGRISYVMSGECFYLPYNARHVIDNARLKPGDNVTFQVCTTSRTFRSWAVNVRLARRKPDRLNGVISSLKENYGFIERSDVVKEIFFHFSELPCEDNVDIGQEVDFSVQTCRNGKETATSLKLLPEGSVVFHDVSELWYTGTVLRSPESGSRLVNTANVSRKDTMQGNISVTDESGTCVQLPFAAKDQEAAYTLNPGDQVQFKVATDRRDQLQKATKISLMVDDTLANSKEKREKGVVVNSRVKEGYGFIMSPGRRGQLFFHFSELLDSDHVPSISERVEYTPIPDPSTGDQCKEMAVRVLVLPSDAVDFSLLKPQTHLGVVQQEALISSPAANREVENGDNAPPVADNIGIILFQGNSMKEAICYELKNLTDPSLVPKKHDKVEFNILECRITGTKVAVNVKVVGKSASTPVDKAPMGLRGVDYQGWIIALKDGYGFLEPEDHSRDIYFNFAAISGLDRDRDPLELLRPVEFTLRKHRDGPSSHGNSDYNKMYADEVRLLPWDALLPEKASEDAPLQHGTVVRLARQSTDHGSEYHGLIAAGPDGPDPAAVLPYTVVSLLDPRAPLQVADPVNFRVANNRAVEVDLMRRKERARVEIFRDGAQFGFLDFPNENGRQLFFHVSEVEPGVQLEVGDLVDFFMTQHAKSSKLSAVQLKRVECAPVKEKEKMENLPPLPTLEARPARLQRKSEGEGNRGPRIELLRQPRGPDGTSGFAITVVNVAIPAH